MLAKFVTARLEGKLTRQTFLTQMTAIWTFSQHLKWLFSDDFEQPDWKGNVRAILVSKDGFKLICWNNDDDFNLSFCVLMLLINVLSSFILFCLNYQRQSSQIWWKKLNWINFDRFVVILRSLTSNQIVYIFVFASI